MQTPAEKAETARRNGARSKGPVTEEGKSHSRRNAITHGQSATALAPWIPPHSALLDNEDRQAFYKLYDLHLAKYRPADHAEQAIVREITDCHWTNFRLASLRTAKLNRALAAESGPEATLYAYEALAKSKTLIGIRREYVANTRLIATLERRLHFMQKNWPAQAPAVTTADADRAQNLPPQQPANEPSAEVGFVPPQVVVTTEEIQKRGPRVIHLASAPTPALIDHYRSLFPTTDLIFQDPPAQQAA